ncbi:universal stress protein A-like protein [Triticum dicoccoides]|uniref:universal stress protein A-like protein n=1 Tax=Triticum dicoccoides TaxID=85692 RepID=UPI001891CE69|nr:universal stress protein A-like protein [Triticum dicoccoides]
MADSSAPTRVMMAVNESSLKGYPHPSISCRSAFDWMLSKLVRSNTDGFHLLFLHVQVPDEDGFDDMDSIYASPTDFQSMKQRDRIRGIHLLEYFVSDFQNILFFFSSTIGSSQEQLPFWFLTAYLIMLQIKCEAWTKQGDPKEVICHEVKRVQPDLLVVGSRGLGPFQRVFVGTVSEFCVKHAECPVITIKRKANEAPQDPIDD